MPGSSEGTSHPLQVSKDLARRRGSWHLPVTDGAYSTIPAWTSRESWIDQVDSALASAEGRDLCRANRVSATAARAVAAAHAGYADSGTGRTVTAAVASIATRAGVSTSVVNRTRRVLVALKLAREVVGGRHLRADERVAAKASHGGRQISAASVWALSTPIGASAQIKQRDSLPSPRRVSSSSSVRKNSPKPRKRGPKNPRRERAPRPLHTQRAAAHLVSRLMPSAPSLGRADRTGQIVGDHVHIGAVADTLTKAGIDTERWTGHAIADVIDAQQTAAGWVTGRIESPLGWLRHRLAALAATWAGPSPADRRRDHLVRIEAESAARAAERAAAKPASSATRAAAMAQFSAKMAAKRAGTLTVPAGEARARNR